MAKLKDRFAELAQGGGGLGFDPLGGDESLLKTLKVEDIEPDPTQPRKLIDDLEELKGSIRQHGILQPLVVSPIDSNRYRLIAGERRFTAAKQLNLRTVPALVRTVQDHHRLEIQLVENLHRKGLDPFEEAGGYQRLAEEFSLVHEEIAKRIGKSRSYITQTLSLTRVPKEVQEKCQTSDIHISRDTLYLVAKQDSEEKMLEVLALATAGQPKEVQREAARKGAARQQSSARKKPKVAFSTAQEATVIVQSQTDDLTKERTVAALEEALSRARQA